MSIVNLDSELHGAVRRGEIVAYFQPQIDVASGKVIAVEALSRWHHPTRGLLEPGSFISVAEENGLIHEIGNFMVETSCRCAASWNARGYNVEVAVNVSAVQLATRDFFERLATVVTDSQLVPNTLTIEITESLAIDDITVVTERLEELRSLDIAVSLDDFGVGHSSIGNLLNLPATEVKIDRSLLHDGEADGLIEAVVAHAQARGIRVVAEGVETLEQFERVRHMKIDRAQGFLFARPMPEADIERMLVSA
jgi:EAL domain-containing protein (putative c-di-GMP-specific phosphodiesterase class I)